MDAFTPNWHFSGTILLVVNPQADAEFENGCHTAQVPLISLFGASNELPQEAELEALFDRFLLRMTCCA